jgi:hypothetical protein
MYYYHDSISDSSDIVHGNAKEIEMVLISAQSHNRSSGIMSDNEDLPSVSIMLCSLSRNVGRTSRQLITREMTFTIL